MADNVKVTVTIEKNGLILEQIVRRVSLDELEQFSNEQTTGASYVTTPNDELDTIQFLLFKADQAVSLRFNAQSDAGLSLNANGIVLIIDGNINSGSSTNLKCQNNSGATANLKGVVGGT